MIARPIMVRDARRDVGARRAYGTIHGERYTVDLGDGSLRWDDPIAKHYTRHHGLPEGEEAAVREAILAASEPRTT